MIHDVKNDPILQVPSQGSSIQCPPIMTSRMGVSWHISIHARELKFGTQVNNHISWRSMMSRMTPSSKYPLRNNQHPPSMTSRTGDSWHSSIHARELTFGTQVKRHISWGSMMSTMTPSTKYPVGNHQCPPSMSSRTGNLDTLIFMLESWHLAHKSRVTYHDDTWCQQWQSTNCFSSLLQRIYHSWVTSKIDIGWYIL